MGIAPLPRDFFGLELRGRKLGRYELLHRITRGGMSEVLLGQQRGHAGFRKLVILKRVAADTAFGSDAATQMLIREARLTAGFVHSNIAQVYDLELIEGGHFLSMEFVPGVTLREVLAAARDKRERPPLGFALSVVRDLAEALHYAHTFTEASGRKRPVIHRDVAPKNVMVRWDGVTKLLDFGLARTLDGPSQTLSGTVKGTVAYMSPEQIHARPLDARTDVFSLGLVLHELLSGAPLSADGDQTPAALRPSIPTLASRMVGAPLWVDVLLGKMLAADAELRMSSAREVSREILRLGLGALWELDAVASYLEYLFSQERAQMQQLLAELAPDEPAVLPMSPDEEHTPPLSPVPLAPEPRTVREPAAPVVNDASLFDVSEQSTRLRPGMPSVSALQPLMDEADASSVQTDTGHRPLSASTTSDSDVQSVTANHTPLMPTPHDEAAPPPAPEPTAARPAKRRGRWVLFVLAGGAAAFAAWYFAMAH